MFQERDGEKEILLGNKQLLGIFFVLAILFGVFFTAGYMVGHTGGSKVTAETTAEAKSTAVDSAAGASGETHQVSPDPVTATSPTADTSDSKKPSAGVPDSAAAESRQENTTRRDLAEVKTAESHVGAPAVAERDPSPAADDESAGHRTYLQVAALKHSEAVTVAKVLSGKGFHAHVSPKAGTPLYRVLVGPVKDAGELNSTRAALKNKGFREVFVQHL